MFNNKSWGKESKKTIPSPRARKVRVRNVPNLGLGQTAAVEAVIGTVDLELKQNC